MAFPFSLPENFKIVAAVPNCADTTNALITLDSVSMRYYHKAWLVLGFHQVAGHTTTVTPMVGATVATANAAITFTARNWLCVDVATSDALVEQAAATTADCDVATTDQVIIFEIDVGDMLAQGATFDCLGGTVQASGQVNNDVGGFWILAPRYAQATPPSAIVD